MKAPQKIESPKGITVSPCRPVFANQKDMDDFFCQFREEVGPDLKALREARIKGEIALANGFR